MAPPHTALSRRRLLGAGAGVLVGTLAGCTRLSEFIADYAVGDVNLFNLSKDQLTGPLELGDPDSDVVLDEAVNLAPESGDKDGEPSVIYEDVLTTAGTYRLEFQFEATGPSDRSTVGAAEELDIADPGDEKIVVFFSERWTDEFLTIRAIEDFAELEDDFEN
ncbi:hypothetical protein [Halovenus salina]|uniref:hypothetical protein n=1 Tax=Halovenus salina TaxID=1510225 RepID=UPI0022609B77|nr:hypothetical protein [Halovenus salina]